MIDSPVATDSITNKQASQEASIYHTCRSVLNGLGYLEGFEEYLKQEDLSDPLTRLWNICRPGISLCFLFNTLNTDTPIIVNTSTTNKSKAYIYHFIIACRDQLHFPEDSLFTVTELCQNDTNGFVKVVNTIKRILELLIEKQVIPEQALKENENKDTAPKDMRDNVVYELLSTERKYVQDLEALQNYMKEVQTHQLLSPDTMHYLFGNLNALVDFQRRFLIQIEEQAANEPKDQRFGSLFIQSEDAFTVYEAFCSNFQIAQDLVVQVAHKLQKLTHIMSATYELPAMLIKPIQRVCKYPLLLQQLIKSTPEDWQYYEETKEGLEAIQRVTKKVNETKRIQENSLVVKDLKKKIFVEDNSICSLDSFGLLLLHDKLAIQKVETDHHIKESVIFLFENAILLCKEVKDSNKNSISIKKKRKDGTLILKGKIPMSALEHVKGSSSTQGQYVLHLTWTEKDVIQTIQLKCRNDEQLRQWLDAIIEIKKVAPTTPFPPEIPEINPILNYYNDDDDDFDFNDYNNQEEEVSFTRNRSFSYQHNRMPPHLVNDQFNRKQSLGNPRYHFNDTPTMPYSPPISNPSSPHHHLNHIPIWQKRQTEDSGFSTRLNRISQQDDIKIKTYYQDSIYNVLVPSSIIFIDLLKKIQDKLDLSPSSIPSIKYEDEDGDLITINSDEDLQMAFEIKSAINVVNFHIS